MGDFYDENICYVTNNMQVCGKIGINVTDHNTLLNPYVGRCTYNRCRKIYYLRDKTFFSIFPKTNISTILYIIKLWISENKNAVQIYNKIISKAIILI